MIQLTALRARAILEKLRRNGNAPVEIIDVSGEVVGSAALVNGRLVVTDYAHVHALSVKVTL